MNHTPLLFAIRKVKQLLQWAKINPLNEMYMWTYFTFPVQKDRNDAEAGWQVMTWIQTK